MVTSAFVGVAAADAGTGIAEDDADPADEIFVDEDGNAILVYEGSDDEDDSTGEIGLDVAEGLVYGLVSEDVEEDVSAAFSMALDRDGLEGEGSMAFERPEEITDFSMDISGTQTQETNEFEGSLDMTIDTAEEQTAGVFERASTAGEIVSTPDRLTTSGHYALETGLDDDSPTGIDVAVSGTDNGYTVDVQQTREGFDLSAWETEADAREMLQMQYGSIATELGGEATITVHSHDYEASGDEYSADRLELDYTIEYEGIDEQVATLVAAGLAEDPELDLDDAEAEAIADAIVDVEIETIEFSHTQGMSGYEGEWNVDIANLEPLTHATFDLIGSLDEFEDDAAADAFEDLRASLDARQEADLTQTATWDAEFEQTDSSTATLSAEFATETENWGAYVQELEASGLDTNYDLEFDASGELDGDEIAVESQISVSGEDLVSSGISALLAEMESDPTADEESVQFLEALDEAGLQVAAMDFDMSDGTMTLEAGAKFDDLSALEDVLEDSYDGMTVSHLYSSADDDGETTYVYADGLVDDGTDEDAIRSHAAVDSDTTIHLAGEWDEEHPRLDTDHVREYLGLDASGEDGEESDDNESSGDESEDETEDEDNSMPGFGVAVALVALLSAAALNRRD